MTQQSLFWVPTPKLKIFTCKHIFTPMFTAALFMVIETWKPPRCASVEDWIKKMWSIDTRNTAQPPEKMKY